jgi:tetratricopeptide (TPR) repeat protein
MELKAARCPSCGGDLNIPESVDYVECPFCGIDVKVRDIVSYELDSKSLIELAGHALNTGNYKSALDYYSYVIDKEPGNPFAILGKIKATIRHDWDNGERKTSGVREFIMENLGKIDEDKRTIYADNISEFICGLYDEEIKKYKDDMDMISKANEFVKPLMYLLETAYEINPANEKTITTILDYCMVLRGVNATAVGSVMKEEKVEELFKKYSEALGKLDLVKAAEYAKKSDEQVTADKTQKSNMRVGCVMLLITLIVIALIIWFIVKGF